MLALRKIQSQSRSPDEVRGSSPVWPAIPDFVRATVRYSV